MTVLAPAFKVSTPVIERVDPTSAPPWGRQSRKLWVTCLKPEAPVQDVEDYSSNYVERDERRLADLGRRAVEVYAVSHILRELESVHSMEESIKRQDALIREVLPTTRCSVLHKRGVTREVASRSKGAVC